MREVGQRKRVTVLFSDLVESTAIGETIDPEGARRRGSLWSGRTKSLYLQARAKLAATYGKPVEALELASQAVDILSDTDTPQDAAAAHKLLGELLASAGDPVASTAELSGARELYAGKGYRPGVEA